MADTFNHLDLSESMSFGSIAGDPRGDKSLRKSVTVGARRVESITGRSERHGLKRRAGIGEDRGEGDGWLWSDGEETSDAGGHAPISLGSTEGFRAHRRAIARENAMEVPQAPTMPSVLAGSKEAQQTQSTGTSGHAKLGGSLMRSVKRAAYDAYAQRGKDARTAAQRRGDAYADIAGNMESSAGGGEEPTSLSAAGRRYNLRRVARALEVARPAGGLIAGGDGADAGDVASSSFSNTLTGRLQGIAHRAWHKLLDMTIGRMLAILGAPSAVGLLIPLLVFFPLIGFSMLGGCAQNESAGQGGGSRVAAIAEAEYNSGVASGTYHRDDPKYWNFVFPGMAYVSGEETPWCACFVSWCADQAGFVKSGIMHVSGGADYWRYYEENPSKGSVLTVNATYTPQLGDVLTYRGSGGSSEHVGIVSSIADDGSFYTTEGNTSGSTVNRHHHQKTADGYGNTNWGMPATVSRPRYPSVRGGVIEIPEPYGNGGYTVTEYDLWFDDWAGGTNQRKVADEWASHGCPWLNDIAAIDGRYLVACTTTYGDVGDKLTFYLSDGTEIPCIMADAKSMNDPGCNKWGHSDGQNVLEFEVKSARFRRDGNPGTSAWLPEWAGKRVVRCVNESKASSMPSEGIQSVIDAAMTQLGIDYDWNYECHPYQSMDCSSLVWYAYTTAGYSIPRCQRYSNGGEDSMYWWCANGGGWTTNQADLQAGDLLFWGPWYDTGHVALCIGNGQIIHANYGGVEIDSVYYSAGSFLGGGPII